MDKLCFYCDDDLNSMESWNIEDSRGFKFCCIICQCAFIMEEDNRLAGGI